MKPAKGCAVAVVLAAWLAATVVTRANATCPPAGKANLGTVTADNGTVFDVYAFRGTSTQQMDGGQPYCVLVGAEKFIRSPVAVMGDQNGDHYVTQEFAAGMTRIPASAYDCDPDGSPACAAVGGLREVIEFPVNDDRLPFATSNPFGSTAFCPNGAAVCQTEYSNWTIGITTSPGAEEGGDRIWVPQPGMDWVDPKIATIPVGSLNVPVSFLRNHSRLVAYDTSVDDMTIYNLPGDWNHVLSPIWDASNERLVFLETAQDHKSRSRIGILHPDDVDSDIIGEEEDFRDPAKLDAAICPTPNSSDDCITYFNVPIAGAHTIALGADGLLWGAESLSNALFSLDLTTGDFDRYPLPPGGHLFLGRGPNVGPPDSEGILWFGEYISGMVGAIDSTAAPDTPSCKTLDGSNENPCVYYFDVPGAFTTEFGSSYGTVTFLGHEPFVDALDDVVWFDGGASEGPAPGAGYIERSTGEIHFLEAIDDPVRRKLPSTNDGFPERVLYLEPAQNGIDLWGVDYFGGRLYLLKRRV